MSAVTQNKHYHDIDGARSVLMFLSVALHAGTVYAPARLWITTNTARHEFFDWLIFGFHLFVTPTFFFVGGFFAVLLLTRRTVGDFLLNRLLRTGVPLVTIAITLNMIELYLRYVDAGGSESPFGWIGSANFVEVWSSGLWALHLWFLVSLVPMFFLAALIEKIVPRESGLRGRAVAVPEWLAVAFKSSAAFAFFLLLLAAANTANYLVAGQVPGAYELIFPGFQSWYKLVSEFPFFVIGVMAALSPAFLATLVKWRWYMPYAAAAALILQPYANPEQSELLSLFMLFANQLAIWTIVLFILQFFHRYFINGGPRTAWLADCALSMYLFHHCLVYVYGRWLVPVEWPIWLEFSLLTAASALTVIVVHEYVVRRFGWARLLFNGKTDIDKIRAKRERKAAAGTPGLAAA
ncbi:acyltransferase family protein [Pontixanthobacter aestiaquae]|uniref:Acyltransferase family protein n=1 Tax=Pontixanthobacter aestiaquae TaxID=1509367 RepID=A0A844Z5U1_9SPHN|nr:acyltransferase family protein [Pontixanthobacter aestiaquae]MDN3646144.1 acyltransferase family protein [Pontixanthobacter aestiaquae]MXO82864.1 acyltransferase family protein [Pontixanthobacter aestiaquae]